LENEDHEFFLAPNLKNVREMSVLAPAHTNSETSSGKVTRKTGFEIGGNFQSEFGERSR
jgi:hypothetical protein